MKDQIAETVQLLPSCKTKIENAIEDLQNFLSQNDENDEVKELEEWKLAEQTLAEVSAFAETIECV